MRHIIGFTLFGLLLLSCQGDEVWARGFGGSHAAGGFHAGGFHGGAVGGFHPAQVRSVQPGVGVYHGGAAAGFHPAQVRSVHPAVGVYHGGAVGAYRGGVVGGYRTGAVGVSRFHAGVPTDFGVGRYAGAVTARRYVGVGHRTYPISRGLLAARGLGVREGFFHNHLYTPAWWRAHPRAWWPAAWTAAAANAWAWNTWPTLAGWFGWSAPPVYFDYGNNIVYQDGEVYSGGQPIATADQYYQQAYDLAQALPSGETAEDQWQPLGVFALVQGDQTDSDQAFQLAVNKTGVIRGNYSNALTGTTYPVRGTVDPQTQRAAWTVGDNKDVVYDTGIYNLTQDQAPVLVHFGKDRTQQWLLVRLQGEDQQPAATGPAAEPPAPAAPGDNAAPASVIVRVPADAQLWFDGVPVTQVGTQRVFASPPLQPGTTYTYQIRARWTSDGHPVEQTQQVLVRSGERVTVDFPAPSP
jgi:uncharacterized protein (TIGR03000 family)